MVELFCIVGKKFSGKSLVSYYLRKNFIPVINLEEMYKSIFLPGTNCYKILINHIGEDIIDLNGHININKLSLLICKEIWIRELIDEILSNEFISITKKFKNVLVSYNIPFGGVESNLVTKNEFDNFDFLINVNSSIENRKCRMINSNIPKIIVDKILQKESIYDYNLSRYKINNNSSINELEKKCNKIIQLLNEKK